MKLLRNSLIAVLFFGCVSLATEQRRDAFNLYQEAFRHLPPLEKPLTVVIDRLTVRIVPKIEPPLGGMAISPSTIIIEGRIVDGKVVINQAILGHELQHILAWKSDVANPDELDEIGAYEVQKP